MAQVQGGRGGVRVPLAAARPPFYSFSNTILPIMRCRLSALPSCCPSLLLQVAGTSLLMSIGYLLCGL